MLKSVLDRFLVLGTLTVRWPDGDTSMHRGHHAGASVSIAITTPAAVKAITYDPAMALGECYMDGTLLPLDGTIYDVLDLLIANLMAGGRNVHLERRARLGWLWRRVAQHNPARKSRSNVAHHYDLNGRLYSLFLDRDRQYSCAYFRHGRETLEEAQSAKKHHIAAKLRLDRPDLTVLDIGCGWGGMALTLARDYGARVTGITLSTEQLHEARARAEAEGLADRVNFELMDYRSLDRSFDRIVSVGMFEHVGVGYYKEFFEVWKRALKPDGVALLHAIGRSDGPGTTNSWIAKYIFPGGYSPALSEVIPAVEKVGLIATDIEVLRLHYAETLRHWRRRFAANRDTIASLYDDRFCRMFEFYLAGSEIAFRREHHMIFQIQLTREQTAAPLTRDYMTSAEREKVKA